MKKTKYDMIVDILSAVLQCTNEKANKLAEENHYEFKRLMKLNKAELLEMHSKAIEILNKGYRNKMIDFNSIARKIADMVERKDTSYGEGFVYEKIADIIKDVYEQGKQDSNK